MWWNIMRKFAHCILPITCKTHLDWLVDRLVGRIIDWLVDLLMNKCIKAIAQNEN